MCHLLLLLTFNSTHTMIKIIGYIEVSQVSRVVLMYSGGTADKDFHVQRDKTT
jgi:hypothetical protein